MKNLLIIGLFLLAGLLVHSQDFEKSNALTIIHSPGSLEDGYSLGIQYEYQNRTVYLGPELYYFPNLNDLTYTHLIGRIGLNHHINGEHFYNFRVYSGVRIGGIFRETESSPYGLLGLEGGLDFKIPSTDIIIGGTLALDMKADSKLYSRDSYHTVYSTLVRIGFIF